MESKDQKFTKLFIKDCGNLHRYLGILAKYLGWLIQYDFQLKYVGDIFVLFAAVLCCVFIFGVITDNVIAEVIQSHDKLVHFIAFYIESWLFCCVIVNRTVKLSIGRFLITGNRYGNDEQKYRCWKINKFTLALVICLSASFLSEFLQKLLSNGRRTFDPMDMLYNAMGSLLGIAIAYIYE